jgi:hypothetical protein
MNGPVVDQITVAVSAIINPCDERDFVFMDSSQNNNPALRGVIG